MIRTYHELVLLDTFEKRYDYLRLHGQVGRDTFGYDRYINQRFYHSFEWKNVRDLVIIRDNGCDLGMSGYSIGDRILVHHMNPIEINDFRIGNPDILDPDFLICTSPLTHQAIHFSDRSLLPQIPIDRQPGDTKLW